MKNNIYRYVFLIAVCWLGVILGACSSDNEGGGSVTPGDGDIELAGDILFLEVAGDEEHRVAVNSEVVWEVADQHPEWLHVTKESDNTIVVKADANSGAEYREAMVKVVTNTDDDTMTIYQAGTETKPKISFSPDVLELKGKALGEWDVKVMIRGAGDGMIPWVVRDTKEWVDVRKIKDEGMLVVTAEDNRTHRSRKAEVVVESFGVEATLEVTQDGYKAYYEELTTTVPPSRISYNGRYLVGAFSTTSMAHDIATGNTILLDGYGVIENLKNPYSGTVVLRDISNAGLAVGAANTGAHPIQSPILFDIKTEELKTLKTSGTILGDATGGSAWAISPDGRVVGGYIYRTDPEDLMEFYPTVWIDGKPVILANPNGEEGLGSGVRARGYQVRAISPDGSTAFGYSLGRMNQWICCYWKLDDPDEIFYIRKDDPEFFQLRNPGELDEPERQEPIVYPEYEYMTADGKTIMCSLQPSGKFFLYNIETGNYRMYDGVSGEIPLGPASGDVLFYHKRLNGPLRTAHVYSDGASKTLEKWLMDEHEIDIPQDEVFITLCGMDGSETTIIGFNYTPRGYVPVIISF